MKASIQDKSKGFTLIELLVVIAIIAILAAILFPVFAKVREKARQTTCLSNEKQIGLATQQYIEDYDEMMPIGNSATAGGYSGIPLGWAGLIYPYAKSVGIFLCPDDTNQYDVVSYAMNAAIDQLGTGTSANPGGLSNSLSIFTAPASTVLLYETTGSGTYPGELSWYTYDAADIEDNYDLMSPAGLDQGGSPWGYSDIAPNSPWSGVENATGYTYGDTGDSATLPGRHTDGSNYLLVDGHAKWYRGAAVSGGWPIPESDLQSWFGISSGCEPGYNSAAPAEYVNTASCGNVAITFNPT